MIFCQVNVQLLNKQQRQQQRQAAAAAASQLNNSKCVEYKNEWIKKLTGVCICNENRINSKKPKKRNCLQNMAKTRFFLIEFISFVAKTETKKK